MTLPSSSASSQSASISTHNDALRVGRVFAEIFIREALRAMEGNRHQLKQSVAQLRACLDKIEGLEAEQ